MILAGWASHRDMYDQVLAELDAVDIAYIGQTRDGIVANVRDVFAWKAANVYKSAILPLCWEALLKYRNEWPDWKVITFLRMLRALAYAVPDAIPDEGLAEALMEFAEGFNDGVARNLAERILDKLRKDATLAWVDVTGPGPQAQVQR